MESSTSGAGSVLREECLPGTVGPLATDCPGCRPAPALSGLEKGPSTCGRRCVSGIRRKEFVSWVSAKDQTPRGRPRSSDPLQPALCWLHAHACPQLCHPVSMGIPGGAGVESALLGLGWVWVLHSPSLGSGWVSRVWVLRSPSGSLSHFPAQSPSPCPCRHGHSAQWQGWLRHGEDLEPQTPGGHGLCLGGPTRWCEHHLAQCKAAAASCPGLWFRWSGQVGSPVPLRAIAQ